MTLTRDQRQALSKILELNGHQYDEFMANFRAGPFPIWKIDQLCEWINDEFMMHGLAEDDRPNEYGFQLERLLDAVNRQRLDR
jgi:hypothetical protein